MPYIYTYEERSTYVLPSLCVIDNITFIFCSIFNNFTRSHTFHVSFWVAHQIGHWFPLVKSELVNVPKINLKEVNERRSDPSFTFALACFQTVVASMDDDTSQTAICPGTFSKTLSDKSDTYVYTGCSRFKCNHFESSQNLCPQHRHPAHFITAWWNLILTAILLITIDIAAFSAWCS